MKMNALIFGVFAVAVVGCAPAQQVLQVPSVPVQVSTANQVWDRSVKLMWPTATLGESKENSTISLKVDLASIEDYMPDGTSRSDMAKAEVMFEYFDFPPNMANNAVWKWHTKSMWASDASRVDVPVIDGKVSRLVINSYYRIGSGNWNALELRLKDTLGSQSSFGIFENHGNTMTIIPRADVIPSSSPSFLANVSQRMVNDPFVSSVFGDPLGQKFIMSDVNKSMVSTLVSVAGKEGYMVKISPALILDVVPGNSDGEGVITTVLPGNAGFVIRDEGFAQRFKKAYLNEFGFEPRNDRFKNSFRFFGF